VERSNIEFYAICTDPSDGKGCLFFSFGVRGCANAEEVSFDGYFTNIYKCNCRSAIRHNLLNELGK
jgi:hypothetical protein